MPPARRAMPSAGDRLARPIRTAPGRLEAYPGGLTFAPRRAIIALPAFRRGDQPRRETRTGPGARSRGMGARAAPGPPSRPARRPVSRLRGEGNEACTPAWLPGLLRPTPPNSASPPARVPDHRLVEDLLFLETWERGLVPWPGALLRVRQIRRANPALVAQVRGNPTPPGTVPPLTAGSAELTPAPPVHPPAPGDATLVGHGVACDGR